MASQKQLTIQVASTQLDAVEAALFALGALSISVSDAEDQPVFEHYKDESPLWDSLTVQALFPPQLTLDELQGQLALAVGPAGVSWQLEPLDDRDWHAAWLDRYEPMCFGDRLWVCPSWKPIPAACQYPVIIDPGLAFGTGTHATTAMCLQWLDQAELEGSCVLDFGCGTGILAIAAAKLGAKPVVAVDNDPEAVVHSRDNVARNALSDSDIICCDLLEYRAYCSKADVVIANILAGPLIKLAPELGGLLASDGQLVLSGILESQAEQVIAAYNDTISFIEPMQREEWMLLHGRKRQPVNSESVTPAGL